MANKITRIKNHEEDIETLKCGIDALKKIKQYQEAEFLNRHEIISKT